MYLFLVILLYLGTINLECGLDVCHSSQSYMYDYGQEYIVTACFCTVQEDLLKGDEDAEFITELSKKITMPTLILWGDHDRVRDLHQ